MLYSSSSQLCNIPHRDYLMSWVFSLLMTIHNSWGGKETLFTKVTKVSAAANFMCQLHSALLTRFVEKWCISGRVFLPGITQVGELCGTPCVAWLASRGQLKAGLDHREFPPLLWDFSSDPHSGRHQPGSPPRSMSQCVNINTPISPTPWIHIWRH